MQRTDPERSKTRTAALHVVALLSSLATIVGIMVWWLPLRRQGLWISLGGPDLFNATFGKIPEGWGTYLFYKSVPWLLLLTGVTALIAGGIAASRSQGWRRGVTISYLIILLLIITVPTFELLTFFGVIPREPIAPPLRWHPPSPASPPPTPAPTP